MKIEARKRLEHHRSVLKSRDWWHGKTVLHQDKRAHVDSVLKAMEIGISLGLVRKENVDRIGAELQCVGFNRREVTGQSVAWSHPKRPIRWIDVPGEKDPEKARAHVRERHGEKLTKEGYSEYSVAPITRLRRLRPEELPEGVLSLSPSMS